MPTGRHNQQKAETFIWPTFKLTFCHHSEMILFAPLGLDYWLHLFTPFPALSNHERREHVMKGRGRGGRGVIALKWRMGTWASG